MTKELVVLGDVILDRDIEVEEATGDFPVFKHRRSVLRGGGAALSAALLAREGFEVTLVTAISLDPGGKFLLSILQQEGVRVVPLVSRRSTPSKTRIRASMQTVGRLDTSAEAEACELSDLAGQVLASASAILVSDYGLGVTKSQSVRKALERLARTIPVVWDPHPHGGTPVANVALCTPNLSEALKLSLSNGDESPQKIASRLLVAWRASAVCITLGDRGSYISVAQGYSRHITCDATECVDTCGAGDAFAMSALISLSSGLDMMSVAAQATNRASKFVTNKELATMNSPIEDVFDVNGGGQHAPRNRKIVATGGCFDVIHPGHIATLEFARAQGHRLVVLLNSDASVGAIKGPARPINTAENRKRILEALRCVDEVIIFDDATPIDALRTLRPDIWVKGGDYEIDALPEAVFLEAIGTRVLIAPKIEGFSTTVTVEAMTRISK